MSPFLRGLLAAPFLLGALPARAHVQLLSPVSRYGLDMKVGPCGQYLGTRTTKVTTFKPGEVVTVSFSEIIDHPGYFRIAFDPAGDDDLAPPVWNGSTWDNPANVQVLADHIQDAVATQGSVAVTLPGIECATYTLQLIQVMTDKPPYDGVDDFYYQCADLVLSSTAPPPPPPTPPPPEPAKGGCRSLAGEASTLALLAAVLSLLALRRRRRPPSEIR